MAIVDAPNPTRRRAPSTAVLRLLVFTGGIVSLSVELSASRLLAPFFGDSLFVYANVIGLTLGGLSLGYWYGGRLADRRPDYRLLCAIVAVAAVCIAVIPFVARPVLEASITSIGSATVGAFLGSLVGTLVLFVVPLTLLGVVSPFAVRLATSAVERSGRTAGGLYALSTVGSILGTFLTAILALPLLGTTRTMVVSAALLAAIAVTGLPRRRVAALLPVALVALALVPPGAVNRTEGLVFETESAYQYVRVIQRDDMRYLLLNEGGAIHSQTRDDGNPSVGGYWDRMSLLPALVDRPGNGRLLVLGNAGGTIGRGYGAWWPTWRVDGVEIDPAVTKAGRDYLRAGDNPNVETITADARPFVRTTDRTYDAIVVDAFHQPYIPFHLTTREFFSELRGRLKPGGLVALNVGVVPGDDRVVGAIAATLAREFRFVESFPVGEFNVELLASDEPPDSRGLADRVAPALRPAALATQRDLRPADTTRGPVLTDDRAPVELLTDQQILDYIRSGGARNTPLGP